MAPGPADCGRYRACADYPINIEPDPDFSPPERRVSVQLVWFPGWGQYAGNDPVNTVDPTGLEYEAIEPVKVKGEREDPWAALAKYLLLAQIREMDSGGGPRIRDYAREPQSDPSTPQPCPDGSMPVGGGNTVDGDATYYNLKGSKLAGGGMFDPDANTAAMYRPGAFRIGDLVNVQLQNAPYTSVTVQVNDTGPFARGANGKAVIPLQPDPVTVIDLTPKGFTDLTGSLKAGRVPVTVRNLGRCPAKGK